MKKPIKIAVYGETYELNLVDGRDERLLFQDTLRPGVTYHREQQIFISAGMTEGIFKKVLLHEIAHVFIEWSGMGQVKWEEENVADFLCSHFQEIENTFNNVMNEVHRKNWY